MKTLPFMPPVFGTLFLFCVEMRDASHGGLISGGNIHILGGTFGNVYV